MGTPKHYLRSRDEIEAALCEQLGFLQTSCRLYDDGAVSEAARIATAVFILVNDGSQQSLFTQLGIRKQMEFISYAREPVPGNLLAEEPLVSLRLSNLGVSYLPVLDQGPTLAKKLKFSHWWERETVFNTPTGQRLDRKRLVYAMRNQDGGSHVDPRLTDEAYVTFSRHARWTGSVNGRESLPDPRPHQATMRQIGFELLRSADEMGLI